MKPSQNRINQQRYAADMEGRPFDLVDLETTRWFSTLGEGSEGYSVVTEGVTLRVRSFGPERDYLAIERIVDGERCLHRPLIGTTKKTEPLNMTNDPMIYELNLGYPGLALAANGIEQDRCGRHLAASQLRLMAKEPFYLLKAGIIQDADILFWTNEQNRDYFDIATCYNKKIARKLRDKFLSTLTKEAIDRMFKGDHSMGDLLRRCGVIVLDADADGMVDLGSVSLAEAMSFGIAEDILEDLGFTAEEIDLNKAA